MTDEGRERQPLPSEDEGDLVGEPAEGMTDDYLVAQEEGVPWTPPTDRVLSEPRAEQAGPDQAGTSGETGDELNRQLPTDEPDEDLVARALEALRRSDLPAGDRLQVGAVGTTVFLRGELDSIDVLDELLAILGDVPGVEDIVDETKVRGV